MTYEQVEKEFDNAFASNYLIADEKIIDHMHDRVKSFLKQSFIKYLHGEVEACNQYKSYYNQSEDQFNKGKHEAMSHMINRLQSTDKRTQ